MFGKNGGSANYRQVSLDDFSDDSSTDERQRNDDFASNSLSRQKQMFQEQDKGLEMLSQSAERLGQMSLTINEELGFQNKMLDEMDSGLEEAQDNLDFVTKKTKELVEKAGGTKNCMIILVLSVIALILFFLILYT